MASAGQSPSSIFVSGHQFGDIAVFYGKCRLLIGARFLAFLSARWNTVAGKGGGSGEILERGKATRTKFTVRSNRDSRNRLTIS